MDCSRKHATIIWVYDPRREKIAPHKDQFVQAFEAFSIAIIGGVKEAAASLRKEIFDRIRSANTPKAEAQYRAAGPG